jgi:hypothetical protein
LRRRLSEDVALRSPTLIASPAPYSRVAQKNMLRNLFLILTRSSYFSMFMMANIIANFVLLAAYDPLNKSVTTQDRVQDDLEPWFQAVRACAKRARQPAPSARPPPRPAARLLAPHPLPARCASLRCRAPPARHARRPLTSSPQPPPPPPSPRRSSPLRR